MLKVTTALETVRLLDVKAIFRPSTRSGFRCQLCRSVSGEKYAQVVGAHVRDEHFNRFCIAMLGVAR